MNFDKEYVLHVLTTILGIDSPSGYTDKVIDQIEEFAKELDLPFEKTEKGNGIIFVAGKDASRTVGVSAHVDTLGAMVRSIKNDGRLAFTRVGGPILPTLDSELCRIYTRDNKVYTGTFLSTSPAAHVFNDASTLERKEETMEVVLDEIVKSKEDTLKLGIENGDYICIDPKTVITESGFIKSRFLDDKLSVSIIFGVLKYMKDNHIQPNYNVKVLISTFEEVGHGMAYLPEDVNELLAVDMGCIGKDLSCTEYDVSICAKDSSGPYDYKMTSRLVELAKKHQLNYAVDIYPFYGSDASAALKAGNNIKAALIGSGVFASHGYERSHYQGVENSMKLLAAYLTE